MISDPVQTQIRTHDVLRFSRISPGQTVLGYISLGCTHSNIRNLFKIFGADTDAIVLHKSASRDQDVWHLYFGGISVRIQSIAERARKERSFPGD